MRDHRRHERARPERRDPGHAGGDHRLGRGRQRGGRGDRARPRARARRPASPSADLGLFKEVVAGIRERCDAIVQPTTGGGVGMTIDERARVVTEIRPEMATFNCGSFNFGIFKVKPRPEMEPWEVEYLEGTRDYVFRNTFADIAPARRAVPRGRHQARVRGLRRRPPLQPAPPRRRGPGRLPAAHPVRARRARRQRRDDRAARAHAPHRDRAVRRATFTWSAAGVGYPGRVPPGRAALMMGGHVRVGLEDNLRVDAGPPRGVERRARGEGDDARAAARSRARGAPPRRVRSSGMVDTIRTCGSAGLACSRRSRDVLDPGAGVRRAVRVLRRPRRVLAGRGRSSSRSS